MIFPNITLDLWLKKNKGLKIVSAICGKCGDRIYSTIPFISRGYVGLTTPICTCGSNLTKAESAFPRTRLEQESWDQALKSIILTSLILMLTACAPGGSGGSSPTQPGVNPTPTPTPSPGQPVTPTPTPTPTPVTCAPLNNTRWVADGTPTLTALSQDQLGQPAYVQEFNLAVVNPTFIENQYVNPGFLTCTRIFNDLVSAGSPGSYVWTDTSGQCGAVVNWFQFDTNTCNVLKVTLRTGSGAIYLTQNYKPF